MSKIKFLKDRDVKSPERAHQFDAGIDFFVPNFTKTFVLDLVKKNPQLFDIQSQLSNSGSISFDTGSIGSTGSTASISFASENATTVEYNSIESVKEDDHKMSGYDNDKKIFGFDFQKNKKYFLLFPHNRVMIPSGIHSRMDEPGRALIGANKSGVATKTGMIFGAHIIDYEYTGEIHISVINTSTKILKIYEDQKLIQFIETPIINSDISIVDFNTQEGCDFYKEFSATREDGGFGSSNKDDKS